MSHHDMFCTLSVCGDSEFTTRVGFGGPLGCPFRLDWLSFAQVPSGVLGYGSRPVLMTSQA